ncbi:uncharacterized protein FYW61_005825 [Anableps anableps]
MHISEDPFSVTLADYSTYYDTENNSNFTCEQYDMKTFSKWFLVTIYSLVFILGFLGNGLVVCVLVKHRDQTNMTDMCLFNLALSDLLFLFTLPFYIHYSVVGEWIFGDFMCRFLSCCHQTGFFSSIFFIVIMTLDRYVVIMHAHKVALYRTMKACFSLIVFTWVLSIWVSLPALIFSKLEDEEIPCCLYSPENESWLYYDLFATNILGLFVPMLVMVVCYSRIIPTLVKMRTAKKHRVVKLIISITIVFFLFWSPYHISRFLKFLTSKDLIISSCSWEMNINMLIVVFEAIAYTHCCLNPIIYAFVGQKFMRRALQLLKKWAPGQMSFAESSFRRSSVISKSSDYSTACPIFSSIHFPMRSDHVPMRSITMDGTSNETEFYGDYEYDVFCNATNVSTNVSTLVPVLYYMLFCVGLIGNGIVLWVLLQYTKIRSMTDVFLLNLVLSDLLMAVSLPVWVHSSQSLPSCKLATGFYQLGFYSGTLFVTLMSVDRYLAIVHAVAAMRKRTLRYGLIASITIWVTSVITATPQVVFAQVDPTEGDNESSQCHPVYPDETSQSWKMQRNFTENVVALFVCLPVMIFCYVNILVVLSKSRNSKKNKALKSIFTVVCLFVLCWVPYNIVVFLETLQLMSEDDKLCEASEALSTAMAFAEIIALSHCCINPVIYAFIGEKFRKTLTKVLSKYFRWNYQGRGAFTSHTTDNETSNTPVRSDY